MAPPPEVETTVRAIAGGVPGVAEVEKCRIRKMGLEYYVDIHIGVNADLTVREGHQIGHSVKDAIQEVQPQVADVLVHIEPVERAGETNGIPS
jgi:divalent metal cation (Fe/Co/Zn/Cd) transporter